MSEHCTCPPGRLDYQKISRLLGASKSVCMRCGKPLSLIPHCCMTAGTACAVADNKEDYAAIIANYVAPVLAEKDAQLAAKDAEIERLKETSSIGTEGIEALGRGIDVLTAKLAAVTRERNELKARIDAIFARCNIVLYRGHEYPFEHNPHAGKDMRADIEAAIAAKGVQDAE